MARIGRSLETTFNQALGEALQSSKARWCARPERIAVEETGVFLDRKDEAKHPDILVLDHQSPPIVIECSFNASDADADAKRRLGLKVKETGQALEACISLFIPNSFRNYSRAESVEALRGGANLQYAIYQDGHLFHEARDFEFTIRRFPSGGFLTGNVHDLAELLDAAALSKEHLEHLAEQVARYVNAAANNLELALTNSQCREIAGKVFQRTPLKGLRTTMVLWLNALLTQYRLFSLGVEGIDAVQFSTTHPAIPTDQLKAWTRIQDKNWKSIFQPAIEILEIATNVSPGATAKALAWLKEAVQRIEVAKLGAHINVGAELFPKLSDDRKQVAAFYTQPATAELLAHLTIRPEDLNEEEWKSGELFRSRTLADLACGTGTLLRSGYRRICHLHERAGGTESSIRNLHQSAMEFGLVGSDISPIAAHLTASSLAAIGSGEPYGNTRIGWVQAGSKNGHMGSLEFLLGSELDNLLGTVGRSSSGDDGDGHAIHVAGASLDWILMNPPYSRTRGGQSAFDIAGLSKVERNACQKRWGDAIRDRPADKRAGMGASFLVLANDKIKPEGRIGFVLPLTAAHAESWAATRRMIERNFEQVVAIGVVGGRALGRSALSADTHIEEMLLVAQKRDLGTCNPNCGEPAPIYSVTLLEPVVRVGEASEIGRAINSAIAKCEGPGAVVPMRIGKDEIGHVRQFATTGKGAPWTPLGVQSAELELSASELITGYLKFGGFSCSLPVKFVAIEDLFSVGPTHDLIGHPEGGDGRGAFQFYKIKDDLDAIGRDRAVWQADANRQMSLEVLPTHKGVAVKGVGSDPERDAMRKFKSILFYARNMRWTSQALLSASTEKPAMGGRAWVALQHKNPDVSKAFALWANSTLGMIVHWTRGQRTQLGRSTTQIAAVKKIPCPRLDLLDVETLEEAAAGFDSLRKRTLQPACQAHCDSTRHDIDSLVMKMLNLAPEAKATVRELRWLWCNEPSVHGNNREAFSLLERAQSSGV